MKLNKSLIILLFLVITSPFFAQNKNVFLNSEFWKANPSVETITSKINDGHNPSEANSNNFDGVVTAILANAPNKSIIYLLSQKGNEVNKLTHDGRTYMFWAAYKGNVELMEHLLEQGAKLDITDDKGSSIINFAASSGQQNTKVYDLCLQNGTNLQKELTPNGANPLLLAAPSDKNFHLINYFQSKGLDINSKDNNGNGVFNYATKSGNIEILDGLLKQGIKGNDQAFVFAAYGMRRQPNDFTIYKYLQSKGLKPNVTNDKGETPLHILASRSDNKEIINYLLESGLDVNQEDNNGNTAFINAASSNNLEMIKLMSKGLKNINATNKKGQTALALAVQNNDLNVVHYLIENGARAEVVDAEGNNLTYYLINSYSDKNGEQFFKKMTLLQTAHVDLAEVQKNKNTWYHLAVEKNSIDLLTFATKMNQDINAKNSEGNTALHIAAMRANDDKILMFLLKNGAKKEVLTDFEETAYDLANENELLEKNQISIEFLK